MFLCAQTRSKGLQYQHDAYCPFMLWNISSLNLVKAALVTTCIYRHLCLCACVCLPMHLSYEWKVVLSTEIQLVQ